MTRSASAEASRGRSSRSRASDSFASAISSASAPLVSSRAQASARSPSAALRWISPDDRPVNAGCAGQDLAEDRAQREDVGPLVHRAQLAPRLLGRHVRRRAHHAAGLREVALRALAAPRRGDDRLVHRLLAGLFIVDHAALGQDLGQAPVHHLHLAERAHHDVGRLEVAVDHAAGVRIGHRLADLCEDRQEPRPILAGFDPLAQAARPACALSPASW